MTFLSSILLLEMLILGSGKMRVDNALINEIRNKVDIVEVISSYIPLTMRGKNYFGVCPFHDDHAPSMSVSKEKQIYTCFSCGATGNVFKFLQDFEHISFLDAVKKCADMSGIALDLKPTETQVSSKYKTLYDIYDVSLKFYQNNINSSIGKKAKEYLYNRNLTDKEIKEFAIGLSLNEYDMLVKLLQQKKYSDKDILKSGLANANDDGLYDIYRERIMFPLHDPSGRVIGYNGRAYQGDMTNKYVNSKETDIFKKRDYLYNYHRAKEEARNKKEVIIMEGPMDVIRAYTIGVTNVVATLGTAFGSSQSNLIRRLSTNVILCFDGDAAGLKATKLAIGELEKVGINPKIVRLPGGNDPDEFILKNGRDAFLSELKKAIDVMEFKASLLKEEMNLSTNDGMAKYINMMIKEINAIDDDILKEVTISRLVKETGVDKEVILKSIKTSEIPIMIKPKTIPRKNRRYNESVLGLLYFMLHDEEAIKEYSKSAIYIPDKEYRLLAFEIEAFYNKYGYIDTADLLTEIHDDEEVVKTIGLIMNMDSSSFNKEALTDYLNNIREYQKQEEINKYQERLKMTNTYEQKLELGNKIIADKIRSEKND